MNAFALALVGFLSFAQADVGPTPPPPSQTIRAETQQLAALACRRLDYTFMVRLSPNSNAWECLRSGDGVTDAIDIERYLRQVRP